MKKWKSFRDTEMKMNNHDWSSSQVGQWRTVSNSQTVQSVNHGRWNSVTDPSLSTGAGIKHKFQSFLSLPIVATQALGQTCRRRRRQLIQWEHCWKTIECNNSMCTMVDWSDSVSHSRWSGFFSPKHMNTFIVLFSISFVLVIIKSWCTQQKQGWLWILLG